MSGPSPQAGLAYLEAAEHTYQAARILDTAFEADRGGVSRMREWADLAPKDRLAFAAIVSEPMLKSWILAGALTRLGGGS